MNETLQNIQTSLAGIWPEVILFLGIVGTTLWVAFIPKPTSTSSFQKLVVLTLVVIVASFLLSYIRYCETDSDTSLFLGSLIHKKLITLVQCAILVASILGLLHIWTTNYTTNGEFLVLYLGVVLGALFLASSSNFLSMFVSLEMVSLCSYAMVAIDRKYKNYESSIKYLTVGAIISAVMLYGISLVYGFTGTLAFSELSQIQGEATSYIIMVMVMAGLLFKLSASPFHTWAPDVYETAPTPLLSFLSTVPKMSAFMVIMRFVEGGSQELTQLLAVIILLTISIGNFAALRQKDAKRMMAYSGIAHAGFLMIGLLSLREGGQEASIFYLLVYALMNIGAFLLIDVLGKISNSHKLSSFSGLGKGNMLLGIATLVLMISLVGIPPSGGFTAKFLLFSSLIPQVQEGKSIALVVLVFAVLNTAVSLFYYLRIPFYMFMKEKNASVNEVKVPKFALAILVTVSLVVLYLFFKPAIITNLL